MEGVIVVEAICLAETRGSSTSESDIEKVGSWIWRIARSCCVRRGETKLLSCATEIYSSDCSTESLFLRALNCGKKAFVTFDRMVEVFRPCRMFLL